jgi:hypothetical protein
MSVYVEGIEETPPGLVIGRLTADSRGELFVFAGRLGLGVPTVRRRGAPDEYVPLTAAGWQDAVAHGALEIIRINGEEHLRAPAGPQVVRAGVHDRAS